MHPNRHGSTRGFLYFTIPSNQTSIYLERSASEFTARVKLAVQNTPLGPACFYNPCSGEGGKLLFHIETHAFRRSKQCLPHRLLYLSGTKLDSGIQSTLDNI